MRKISTAYWDSMAVRKKHAAKFTLSLTLILLWFTLVAAQEIDSLKALLPEKSGIERCDILYGLGYEYIDVDNTLGLQYASESLKEARKLGDSLRIVKAGRIKALAFRRMGQIDSSLILSINILPIAKRNNYSNEVKYILNSLGASYTYQARYDKALESHFESLQLRAMEGDKAEISVALNNIGFNYYKMEDYDKALMFYLRSLKLKNEIKNDFDIELLLMNISLCYAYKNDFAEARYYLDQLLSSCKESCSEQILLNAGFNLGVISFRQNNFTEAEQNFHASYAIAKKTNNQRMLLDNIVYLAQVYIHEGNLRFAENYLKEAEKLILQGTPYSLELIKVYNGLYNLYGNSGNFEKVAHYQRKYIQLKDSIFDQELTRNLMKVEAQYVERENYAKIDAQNKILALNKEVILRQRLLNAFMGAMAILLVILAVVLIRSNRQKRTNNQMLERKVKERTKELELNRDMLQRSLDERDLVLEKISTEIRSIFATTRGLCSLLLTDMETEDRGQYIRRIDKTSEQLLKILRRTISYTTASK